MTPRPLPLPAELELQTVPEGGELTVYRIVKSSDRSSDEFVDSFRSREELGLPPRAGTPEETHPLLCAGISCRDTCERAVATELFLRRRGRGFGNFVAAVRLDQVPDATYYFWGARGHLTVWAEAFKLAGATVDILSIGQESAAYVAIPHPRQSG